MTPNGSDLVPRLAALTERFANLAGALNQAARELQASGAPPPESLAEEIVTARRLFVELRTGILDAARALAVVAPPPSELDSLKSLEPVVEAVAATIADEDKRQAALEARTRMLAVIDRVILITHVDDPGFAALGQCQTTAKELRQLVNDPESLGKEPSAPVGDNLTAFAALLTLIEGREQLDDDRFAALADTVTQSFGRQLAVAATRGKLVIPAAAAAPLAARSSPSPPTRTLEETVRSVPAAPPVPAPPPVAPPPPPPPRVEEVMAAAPAAKPAEEEAGGAGAVEPAVQDEAAQWWVSAWARWTSWKSTLSFNDAVKQELGKYSYLLSVPIQKSTDYEDGLLAYGYSILLEFVERKSPGFVNKALNSLKAFTPGPAKSVGAHLYSFLVTEGRLSEQYPEFVKNVLGAAVPEPGVWTQARILESTVETRVFTHPSAQVGDTEHNSQRLIQDRQRFTDHRFQVALPPLTTRFFAVAGDLRESRAIDVKLSDGRTDIDQAWLLTMPPAGRADLKSELIRLPVEGTSVPGLGKDYATLWVAVFNSDPAAERRYELTLGLRKEAGSKPTATFRSVRA